MADKWKTVNTWIENPDSLFYDGTNGFQIKLDIQIDNGIIHTQGRYLPLELDLLYSIKVDCAQTRLLKAKLTQPIVLEPIWLIRKKGIWYYDDYQPDYPLLKGKPAYAIDPKYEELMSGESQNETNDSIIQLLCNK